MKISSTTEKLAQLLMDCGWSSPNDAQWTNLDMAVGNGKLVSVLFSAEASLREYEEMDDE